jgi:hypothetical protein
MILYQYDYHSSGNYLSSYLVFKTHFGDWFLPPSSGGTLEIQSEENVNSQWWFVLLNFVNPIAVV